jgi:hypothetical protein
MSARLAALILVCREKPASQGYFSTNVFLRSGGYCLICSLKDVSTFFAS